MSKNYNKANLVWDKALQSNLLLYPNENVVRFMASASKRQPAGGNALDVGFGSGQHLNLFMDYGFCAHGTELLDRAVERGKSILQDNPLAGKIIKGDLDHPELLEKFYSLVVVWGCVFLKPKSGILWNLNHINRVLTSSGEACINFRSKENWFYALGDELEPNYYKLDERAREYRDYNYCFLEPDEITTLCVDAGFEITNFERVERWKNNMTERHSWFVVWLQKC